VPAPMWGWAATEAATSSAPVEEEEEEMVGPPRAMEEEDDSDNQDDSARLDEEEEEDGGFVSQQRLGPYVTQRLPGIRSIYTSSGQGRQGGGRYQLRVNSTRRIQNILPMAPTTKMDLPRSQITPFRRRKNL
jgi:hypothetical protein